VKKTRSKLSIEGFVESVSTRKAQSGSWAHEYRIKTKTYSHFTEDAGPLLSIGDYVRFLAQVRSLRSSGRRYHAMEADTIELIDPTGGGVSGKGYVYILSNSSMPGLLKIGYTGGVVADRAAALSATTGVPVPFKVEWILPVRGDAALVEGAAHARLAASRKGKEFFRVALEAAKQVVTQAYVSLYPDAAQDTSDVLSSRMEALQRKRLETRSRLEAERARREYEKSPEFNWAMKGMLASSLLSFDQPPSPSPGFWAQVFGAQTQDWLKAEIFGRAGYRTRGESPWRLIITGSYRGGDLGSRLSGSTDFEHFEQCLTVLHEVLHRLREIRNRQIDLEIATELLDDPRIPVGATLVSKYGRAYTLSTSCLGGYSLKEQMDRTLAALIEDHLREDLPESRLAELRQSPREWAPIPPNTVSAPTIKAKENRESRRQASNLPCVSSLGAQNVMEVVLSLEDFDQPPHGSSIIGSDSTGQRRNDWLQIDIVGKHGPRSVDEQEWQIQVAGSWRERGFWRIPGMNPLPVSSCLTGCAQLIKEVLSEFPISNRKIELRVCGSLLEGIGSSRKLRESDDIVHVPASDWGELRLKSFSHVSLRELLQNQFKVS
jgi:hypothetical protein